MKNRGQAAIEFLLIFVAVFAIISTFIYPGIAGSRKSDVLESKELLNASNAAEGIASRINRIVPGGESGKDSFRVSFSQKWKIIFENGKLIIDSDGMEENMVADLDYSFSMEKEIAPGDYWVEIMKTREIEDNVVVDSGEIRITINPWGDGN